MRALVAVAGILLMAGCDGLKGAAGDMGPQGPRGDPGSSGAAGMDGMKGAKGDMGATGAPGQALIVQTADGGSVSFDGGLAIVAGPTGPKGDQGDKGDPGIQGGGLYVTKTPVYCNNVVVTATPTIAGGFAACNATKDLPLTGGCETTDLTARLANSFPENWAVQTSMSRWNCSWSNPTAPNTYTVHICCITVP